MSAYEMFKLELTELARLGAISNAKCNRVIDGSTEEEIEDYRNDGMRICEIVDMQCEIIR
jgi:hypothetical protein